ncbi:unnamed protein product [marine sediment metagenome]|uniref:Uncharacterized protein n=1 Tax=marine sediment metagenome TaxID=412755 RepID=X0ZSX2_9ZZZZ
MQKLLTPVQYEPLLDELNRVRPLVLTDESRSTLDNAVVNVNPVGDNRPAIGKFARCNQGGALLKSEPLWADDSFSQGITISNAGALVSLTVDKRILGVITRFSIFADPFFVWWCNPAGDIKYTQIASTAWVFLPFVGHKIHFLGEGIPPWGGTITVIGCYL